MNVKFSSSECELTECVCLSVSCYSLRQSPMALPIVQLSCGNWLMGNWPPSSTARTGGNPSSWLVMRLSSAWRPAQRWAYSRSWAVGPESPPWQKPCCCVSWLTTAGASSPCRPSRYIWTCLTLYQSLWHHLMYLGECFAFDYSNSVQNTLLSVAIITVKRKFVFAHSSSAT